MAKGDRLVTDPAKVEWARDPFETLDEYTKRIEANNPYALGRVTFVKDDYQIDAERFPCTFTLNAYAEKWIGEKAVPFAIDANRDVARAVFIGGPTYPVRGDVVVGLNSRMTVSSLRFTANGKVYTDVLSKVVRDKKEVLWIPALGNTVSRALKKEGNYEISSNRGL